MTGTGKADQARAASMSPDDHRQLFAAAMAALLAEFSAYLDRENADPTADMVRYRQIPLWLTKDELAQLISQIRSAIESKAGNEPAPGRSHHLFSPILFPIGQPPQHKTAANQAAPAANPGLPRPAQTLLADT